MKKKSVFSAMRAALFGAVASLGSLHAQNIAKLNALRGRGAPRRATIKTSKLYPGFASLFTGEDGEPSRQVKRRMWIDQNKALYRKAKRLRKNLKGIASTRACAEELMYG